MDDDLSKTLVNIGALMDRDAALRDRALKLAVQALHQIATAQSGQGMRDNANAALQSIAVTLAS